MPTGKNPEAGWAASAPVTTPPSEVTCAEALLAIADDDAREQVGVLARDVEANQAAPILREEGDVAEAERFDELLESVDVAEVGVVGDVDAIGRHVTCDRDG